MVEKLKGLGLEILRQVKKWGPRTARRTLLLWPLIILTWISVYALPDDEEPYEFPEIGGEFFPLSSYPMYSKNGSWTYLVYITDENGEPIPTETKLGRRTSSLKKIYAARLKKIQKSLDLGSIRDLTVEQKAPAGQEVLRHLAVENQISSIMTRQTGAKELRLMEIRIAVNEETRTVDVGEGVLITTLDLTQL